MSSVQIATGSERGSIIASVLRLAFLTRRAGWSNGAHSRYNADLLDQLRSVPCLDCGGRVAQCAMDFDHRDPSSKIRSVTRMIGGSTDRMLVEASKCDIVCANCHRLRTFEQRLSRTT